MQARGPDALSLGWETGGVRGRATAQLLCWMVKVLDEKNEAATVSSARPNRCCWREQRPWQEKWVPLLGVLSCEA